jgi:uncharacterized membrane protein YphA (DoxX/SURF4 family)
MRLRPATPGAARRAGGHSRSGGLLLAASVVVGVLIPGTALAHVKWFEDPTQHTLRTDLILSDRTLLWLATSALALTGLYVARRLVGAREWPVTRPLGAMRAGAPTILAVQAAIGLVSAAARPALLAPNLRLDPDGRGLALATLEVLIAATFITGIADWAGALALIALVPVSLAVFPTLDVLEQTLWVGIGAAVLIIGRRAASGCQARPWFQRRDPAWAAHAIGLLRIATGISLVTVALSEKIWNPGLGQAFLMDHGDFNFVRNALGIGWFSDDLFVIAAGLTEAALGAMLISGLLTRVVVLGAWVPFHLGIPFLPQQELLGHIPVFGIMYLLVAHGSGTALPLLDRPASSTMTAAPADGHAVRPPALNVGAVPVEEVAA